ncbi:hypothetical protein BGZ46_004599 [Entomortierella lignicola]|nr:hypothetical protein BGZ46_004599 [Entomortierella lignicola]
MKAAYLLPLPLLFIPFTHAAGYLIRFKEGSATNTFYHHEGISRIETLHSIKTQSTHSTFNYSSNELSLTVLPLTHIKALSHGKNPHHRGKSKAQIDDSKAFEYGTTAHQAPVKINSKGRWFTFNDDEFHVWHGDFTDEEAELLANDAGVELMEKDIVIQFPELEEYMNNKSTMDDKVMRLEQSLDEMEDQMATKMSNGTKSKEEEEKPTLPNTREGSSLHKDKETKKTHRTKDYVTDSDMKESPEEEDGFMVQKDAPSWKI